MEKHVHNFTIPHKQDGLDLLMCNHEGCRCCDFPGGEDPLVTYYDDYLKNWQEERDRKKAEWDEMVHWLKNYTSTKNIR